MDNTMHHFAPSVVQKSGELLHLMEMAKETASAELKACFHKVTGKRIKHAAVPGIGPSYVSRATNGNDCNPLYRLVGVLVLMQRIGLGRERAQRIVDWMQEIVDDLWPTEDVELNVVLEEDSHLDVQDEFLRFRASHGCVESTRLLLSVKRLQHAHAPVVIAALRHSLDAELAR